MTAPPAGITRWTLATAEGKPGADGSVRRWTKEDAELLATRGVTRTPNFGYEVGKHGRRVVGARCPFCKQMKAIVRPRAELARWCFGCGRASA